MTGARVLALGIGNDLMGDDAAGLLVGAALGADGLPARVTARSGLAVLDEVVGYEKVLLIDSQVTGAAPGTVEEYTLASETVRSASVHGLGYGEALSLGARLGLALPREVRVLAIERSPSVEFGAGLSEDVRHALDGFTERARAILRGWMLEP
jgi:hydrogenase maturation protease